MTDLGAFLRQKVFGKLAQSRIADLQGLAGRDLHDLRIVETVAEATSLIAPWTPLFIVPVGEAAGFQLGVHVRPSDVAEGRVAMVSLQDEKTMVEMAGSPRHLAFLTLLQQEGCAIESGSTEMLDLVSRSIEEALGPGFYTRGRFGDFGREEAGAILADTMGGSSGYYLDAALCAESVAEQRRLLEAGISHEPRCMGLHADLALLEIEEGVPIGAAQSIARALDCYHHTIYTSSLDDLYNEGRALVDEAPDELDPRQQRDLQTVDEHDRLLWITEEFESGNVELATKLLCDMCHERQDYDSVLSIFRKHFERLRWDWALALCDLRG